MDATFSKSGFRGLLFSIAFAFFAGLSFSGWAQRSLAAESETGTSTASADKRQKTSARGSVSFVAPSKPAPKPVVAASKSTFTTNQDHPAKRTAVATAPKNPRSARGDLVLVPRSQRESTSQRQSTSQRPRAGVAVGPTEAGKIANAFRSASQNLPPTSQNPNLDNQVRQAQYLETETDAASPQAKLLIAAHALSLQVSRESDYTRIIKQASQAVSMGVEGEQRQFADQLISWSLNRRGRLRTDEGQQELADADFLAALEKNPNNWRALHNRGVSFAQMGSFAEAFDDFNRVTQISPNFAKAYANRATLFVQANDLTSALEDYRRAAKLDPNLTKAQLGIARIQHAQGQWEEALLHFEAAVKADPTNAEILCSRGDLLADMGKYSKALADYARTVEADPEFAHAYRNGSWLLATCPDKQFRDTENALLGAQQALEFDYGDRHVALDTLAAAQANAGQFDQAISTLKDALAIAPDQAKTAYNQRLKLYQQQRPYRTEPVDKISQVAYEAKVQ